MTAYPDAFFIFKNFYFFVFLGGGGIAQNDKKLCLSPRILGTVPHMIMVFGTHV